MPMSDLLLILAVILFFGLTLLAAEGCDRL